jgi:hypothetical protein
MEQKLAAIAVDTNRLDVFGFEDGYVMHKGWDGASWHPSANETGSSAPFRPGWESLGGGDYDWELGVASWDPGRLDLVMAGWGEEGHTVMRHKARTSSGWSPQTTGWTELGGHLWNDPPAIAAWGPNRLDIFALAIDRGMLHKAWTGSSWYPSQTSWQPLGGQFTSGPAVASWGPNRLDVFGVGNSLGMWHKAWMETHWHPSNPSWQGLGGGFAKVKFESVAPPAVVSWGPDRLDVFGIGKSLGMWHKAWTGSSWYPSPTDWQSLGGKFRPGQQPAVVSWGPDRLDIFAIGDSYGMWHKAWIGTHWHPSNGWQPLGGEFKSGPVVASWGPDRLDVFAVGSDFQMYQKTWNGSQWKPSVTDWQPLGGQFDTSASQFF